ncbi:MAG: DUF4249 family protein [Bacteroidales bacterium]|nr:DUF4249 family protein [Bacteroidales bacterium]
MKDIKIYLLGLILLLTVAACTTKFDLYCYDGDTTIVYTVLDANADTNFFKITKSFLGNANELAYDYEANNYKYDEISVKFIGCFDNSNMVDTIMLDTISKFIPYDENASFYSGIRQMYYFTDRKLQLGKEYQLVILRHSDDMVLSGKIRMTNAVNILKPFSNKKISFNGRLDSLVWVVNDPSTNYHTTAAYFDINGYFHYKELMPGATDTVERVVTWNINSGVPQNMLSAYGYYLTYYTPKSFFTILASDQHLVNNSPYGVQRWIGKFEYCISSIGEELYNYHIINNSYSLIMEVPNYSNIENGIGLMSSSTSVRSFHTIEKITRRKIANDYSFGFIYDPAD